MIFDKNPRFDVCTLEPDLNWKVWKGSKFTVEPIEFEGTAEEIANAVGELRDGAPFQPHYISGIVDCGTAYNLSVKNLEDGRLRAQIHLWVAKHPKETGFLPPLREHLKKSLEEESVTARLAMPNDLALAY